MFIKFNSIENTYQKEYLETIRRHGFWDIEYVVQEKAHGANISFYTEDGKNFVAYRRTGLINSDDHFYNYNAVLTSIKNKLRLIWKEIKENRSDLKSLTIFGELIGGWYPHEDVPKDKSSTLVQHGIYYSPKNEFYAFDILVNRKNYLSVDYTDFLFEKSKTLYAKSLFKGSLDDCLGYSDSLQTTIPKHLGLPELTPNIMEGVIIRPVHPICLPSGSRLLLKKKNDKWAENKMSHNFTLIDDDILELIEKLKEAIAGYVTENRLNNVVSKEGTLTKRDFGRIIGLFNKDIILDFTKDFKIQWEKLDKKESKMVTKSISGLTNDMVRDYFNQNI